uniref:Uncharacterized protein n=1 Tax=Arundo donax TaxID=35708 RepID=A0A0A9ANZ0_ARUDO
MHVQLQCKKRKTQCPMNIYQHTHQNQEDTLFPGCH